METPKQRLVRIRERRAKKVAARITVKSIQNADRIGVAFHKSTNETYVLTKNDVVVASVFTSKSVSRTAKFHKFPPKMKFAHIISDEIIYTGTKYEMREVLRNWYGI